MGEHGWLVNPKRRKRRMPAALARYWAGKRRSKTRGHRKRKAARRGHTHRPRVTIHGATMTLGRRSRYKGRIRHVNPGYFNPSLIKEVGMFNPRRRHHRRHHYNPKRRHYGRSGGHGVGVMSMVRDPMGTVTKGLIGSVGVFMPIAVANWLLPFPGTDIMSRLLRFATRAAAGGLLIQFGGRFLGRSADAFKTGAFIGVAGSTVLDFLGTAVLVGKGDYTQTPMQLLAGFSTPVATTVTGTAGLGAAYTRRSMGAAYSRALGLRGLHGGMSIGTGFKHGLLGGI